MRIDRSRIRVVRQNALDPEFPDAVAVIVGYGHLEIEAWMVSRVAGDFSAFCAGATDQDPDCMVEVIEHRILETVAGLSAHQRIAMIRDGLLVSEIP